MIDLDRITELRDEIGEDDFIEVVELFLEESDEAIAQLGLSNGTDSLEEVFHSLKGSGLNLGLKAFAEICAQAERDAADGRADQIDRIAAIECYNESRAALVAELQLEPSQGAA